jgi:(E)-4-hydroxy-3-methylbut-2-enyl-diphosphate synthase
VGIGACLADGIGDTIRVSLTADPALEIKEARAILSALGMNPVKEMDIISCPTCGRTRIDLIPLLAQFEEELDKTGLRRLPLRVAFMGCVVNGPGEAREADIGICGGRGEGLIIRKGEILYKVPEDQLLPKLIAEIEAMTGEKL